MKQNRYTYYLEELHDVQLVMNARIFIYLDLLLLSCFLFFLLYAQTAQWLFPFFLSFSFLVFTAVVFKVLFREPRKED